MKLYTCYTASHEALYQEWFLPTVPRHFEVRATKIEQVPGGSYKSARWMAGIHQKVAIINAALKENIGNQFLFSDVDVQFFGDPLPLMADHMTRFDFLFQDNAAGRSNDVNDVNTGFFLCAANDRTQFFWNLVADSLSGGSLPFPLPSFLQRLVGKVITTDDQDAARKILRKKKTSCTHALLPPRCFCPGRFWKVGNTLALPKDLCVHHANWTIGLENKIAQLRMVREEMQRRGWRLP